MSEPLNLLFVCLGNICRSPSAENVMRHLAAANGVEHAFSIDSAGTAGYHIGNPPDNRMIEAALERGIEMTGSARQVQPDDFNDFDYVLAMDDENYLDLESVEDQCISPRAKLMRFCDFCVNHIETEVPDPYYGGPEGFEKVLDLLEDGCSEILRQWQAGELPGYQS
ncbi:MAG: low molecular weight protein-tyrosine-phosphatase [Verrucomicrobiota bacterium]